LTHLTWETPQALPLTGIPAGLLDLRIDNQNKHSLPHLPNSIVSLTFGPKCKMNIQVDFPKNLKVLALNSNNVTFTKSFFSNRLEKMIFGKKFKQPITNLIPQSVKTCVFWNDFDGYLPKQILVVVNTIYKKKYVNTIEFGMISMATYHGLYDSENNLRENIRQLLSKLE